MTLTRITVTSVVVMALIGWTVTGYQLVTDRWADASALLVVLTCIATFGATLAIPAAIERRHAIVVLGLLLMTFGASLFAYPVSVFALLLALMHVAAALSRRHQDRLPAYL